MRMSNKNSKLASAIFVLAVAAVPFSTVIDRAARAADGCLTEPNGETPQGKHWYYRIERNTGRHCWYLRGEDEKPRVAVPDLATAPAGAEAAATRAIANAHAEVPAGGTEAVTIAPAATGVTGSVPANTAAPSQITTRWPDSSAATSSDGQPPTARVAQAEQADVATAQPAPEPVAPQPAQEAMPSERNIGSLKKLLLVAFGALGLAGLTGSAVYRLARARRRARYKDRWPPRKVQQQIARAAPQLAEHARVPLRTAPNIARTAPTVDFSRPSEEMDDSNDRVEQIEDFLARLAKQFEAELERPPTRQAAK
jgi:hypothetical protein